MVWVGVQVAIRINFSSIGHMTWVVFFYTLVRLGKVTNGSHRFSLSTWSLDVCCLDDSRIYLVILSMSPITNVLLWISKLLTLLPELRNPPWIGGPELVIDVNPSVLILFVCTVVIVYEMDFSHNVLLGPWYILETCSYFWRLLLVLYIRDASINMCNRFLSVFHTQRLCVVWYGVFVYLESRWRSLLAHELFRKNILLLTILS